MNEIIEQAKAQLMMIEQMYDLKIINRDEVADSLLRTWITGDMS